MADSTDIAALLQPLAVQVSEMMRTRDSHHPLSLVAERITRLIHALEESPPLMDKMTTLQELGFLREHSLTDEMAGFNEVVGTAIAAAMTPGWE